MFEICLPIFTQARAKQEAARGNKGNKPSNLKPPLTPLKGMVKIISSKKCT
jgi:hypothetical protein